jgi:hypothetical protein
MNIPLTKAQTPGTPGQAKNVLPLGWWVLGAVAAVSLADTQIGPVVIAGLTAAVVYNAGQILNLL